MAILIRSRSLNARRWRLPKYSVASYVRYARTDNVSSALCLQPSAYSLFFHPHVHYVVPGGGVVLDSHGKPVAWKATPANFLVDHATLIRVYKAKLAEAFRAAGLYDLVPAEA
jgi:Putative transposase